MVPVDLESVADELYGASPDEFVERRKQRVADARSERDRALVKAIGALRRPTRSAWMVNLLARTAPEDVQQLADLGAALGDAQRRGSGPDLRRLAKERSVTLDSLTRSAVELAAAEGYTATEATRMEVSQTLQAALADQEVADLVRTGRVVQPATYGGFGPMDLSLQPAAAPASTPAEPEAAVAPEPEQPEADLGPDPARVAAEAAVQSAEEALQTAASAAGSAEREAEETTTRADELADRVEELRDQLAAAEAAEREARNAARAARKRAQQLQEALRTAEADVHAAHQALNSVGQDRGSS